MIDYLEMVKEFMVKHNQFIADRPMNYWELPFPLAKLRGELIKEEYIEFENAEIKSEIAKELADLLYVTFGAALTYGIPIDEVFEEVHKSNMTKGFEKNEDGKTLKGKNYQKPDLSFLNS